MNFFSYRCKNRFPLIVACILLFFSGCIGLNGNLNDIRLNSFLLTTLSIELQSISDNNAIPADTSISISQPFAFQSTPFFIDTLNLSASDIDEITTDEVSLSITTSNANFNFLREIELYLSPLNGATEEVLIAFLDTIPTTSQRSITLINDPINIRDLLLADSLVSLRAAMEIREEIDADLDSELTIIFQVNGKQD